MSIKNKLRLGIGFLFLMALLCSGLAAYYLNRLSADSGAILKENYRSLVYSKNIGEILNQPNLSYAQLQAIQNNIQLEQANITEPGEQQLTNMLQADFMSLKSRIGDFNNFNRIKIQMRGLLYAIEQLNMTAIERKNTTAENTAHSAAIIVAFIGSLCFLIAFTFMINFPGYIADPVNQLTEGIKEIADKNYQKRLEFHSNDEFGDVAQAFNQMAGKLGEYENSNLASIMFEKKRIEAIINSVQDAILGLDERMIIVFANDIACTMLGKTEQELIGRPSADVASQNDMLRDMLDADQHKMKLYTNGEDTYFSKQTVDVTNDGAVIGKLIVMKNITEYQQLDEAKTNFIATISHELKTPISSIKMSLKLLEDSRIGDVNEEQKQLLQNIGEDARRLLQITGELLDLTQVETGKITLNFGNTHPQNIVNYAIQAVKFLAAQKEVNIDTDCAETLPNVQADLDKTTWVLINLLSNAIKYSPANSTIQLSVKQVKNDMLEFSVQDSGEGIEEQYLARIFERYFKVPGATADKTGTGLGLAIAKDFIEAQGGNIAVDSKQGEGSRFYYTLKISSFL